MPLEESPDHGGLPVQTEPFPDDQPAAARATRREASARRRTLRWVLVGAGVLVVAAVVIALVAMGGGSPGNSPAGAPPPSRAAFTFPLDKVSSVRVAAHGPTTSAQDVAAAVQSRLSDMYGTAFLDPRSWAGATPATLWQTFAPATRARAQGDAAAFTLKGIGKVQDLKVTTSSLDVEVLYDPSGRPSAAIATVEFEASGQTGGGAPVNVVSTAHLLLRPASGQWFISGYPSASTRIAPQGSSASPSGGTP